MYIGRTVGAHLDVARPAGGGLGDDNALADEGGSHGGHSAVGGGRDRGESDVAIEWVEAEEEEDEAEEEKEEEEEEEDEEDEAEEDEEDEDEDEEEADENNDKDEVNKWRGRGGGGEWGGGGGGGEGGGGGGEGGRKPRRGGREQRREEEKEPENEEEEKWAEEEEEEEEAEEESLPNHLMAFCWVGKIVRADLIYGTKGTMAAADAPTGGGLRRECSPCFGLVLTGREGELGAEECECRGRAWGSRRPAPARELNLAVSRPITDRQVDNVISSLISGIEAQNLNLEPKPFFSKEPGTTGTGTRSEPLYG
jgi:hypothetical protein